MSSTDVSEVLERGDITGDFNICMERVCRRCTMLLVKFVIQCGAADVMYSLSGPSIDNIITVTQPNLTSRSNSRLTEKSSTCNIAHYYN